MGFARRATALVLALSVHAPLAHAHVVTFKIDPAHSEVGFHIRHFFSKVPGRFANFEGTIAYDDKNLAASAVNVTIQAASIDTNHERRDNHLRSADFFAADSFPTLTFKSTRVVPGQEGKFQVEGLLTIRDVTKPVTLDATFLGMGAIAMQGRAMGMRAGWEATTKVDRKDFNIVWNRALDQGGVMLGDDVTITLAIEAMEQMPEAPKPAAPAAKPAEKK